MIKKSNTIVGKNQENPFNNGDMRCFKLKIAIISSKDLNAKMRVASEIKIFNEILDRIPIDQLMKRDSNQVKYVLEHSTKSEWDADCKKLFMIFRFFIQSGEFTFFVQ